MNGGALPGEVLLRTAVEIETPRQPSLSLVLLWGVAFAFWTIPGLLDAAQYYVGLGSRGAPIGWGEALLRALPKWYIWALLTPLIWEIGRRVPLERERWQRGMLVHVPVAVAVTSLHLVLSATAFYLLFGHTQQATLPQLIERYLLNIFAIDFVGYWAILGAFATARFYRMYRERELAASRLQAGLAEARLRALQMQLHPHFLFNTLHAVSSLVLEGKAEASIRMLTLLADLLRMSLEKSDQFLPLAEELELLDCYLEIERLRFEERMSVEMNVEDDVRDAMVPTFILQPLVENAVRHGLARKTHGGRIALSARRDEDRLELRVRDTGPGLRGGCFTPGIGLTNTRARLSGLYGNAASLELGDHPDGGAVVTLRIPFRTVLGARDLPSPDLAEHV